jgi:small subunit ribosomal protein S20
VRQTVSLVDKMAAKGLIHRNTASRYKSRLAARVARKTASAAL